MIRGLLPSASSNGPALAQAPDPRMTDGYSDCVNGLDDIDPVGRFASDGPAPLLMKYSVSCAGYQSFIN